jgi:hypothetical protein
MDIAIDAHSVGAQLAGNETYAVNLIEALADLDQSNRYTLFRHQTVGRRSFSQTAGQIFQVKTDSSTYTPGSHSTDALIRATEKSSLTFLHVQYTAHPRPHVRRSRYDSRTCRLNICPKLSGAAVALNFV